MPKNRTLLKRNADSRLTGAAGRSLPIKSGNRQTSRPRDPVSAIAIAARNHGPIADSVNEWTLSITPERVIREGDPTEQILDVIEKDVDIAMLVLAANPGAEGPGPIITTMAKTMGAFPIPVTIVPGGLTDAEIDALS